VQEGETAGGLTYRELRTPEEMRAAFAIQLEVWGREDATPVNQLLISVKVGGHVLGAFDGDRLVAFAYGFPAYLPGRPPWLASHMLAALPAYRGRGVGRELKWRQRDWCLERGIRHMTWTFDPLEARNAHLNLNVLGAVGGEYVVNCYGEMDDRLNRGLPSDRLVAHWELDGARAQAARRGELTLPAGGRRVAIPRDLQALKSADMGAALEERLRVRAALAPALAEGWIVAGYDRDRSELVLVQPPPPAQTS
jgi:predicted GNAT superfamily acetyltransferase